jgi:hypothetical protein
MQYSFNVFYSIDYEFGLALRNWSCHLILNAAGE